MSNWEEQKKYADAVKYLAHYIAYKLDGVHFAVNNKYWTRAREIVDNIGEEK